MIQGYDPVIPNFWDFGISTSLRFYIHVVLGVFGFCLGVRMRR